jgi:3-carboxy-cis,cis-muconate cycloisomerase
MTEWMSRPQAQAEVKRLCAQAAEQGCALSQLAARDFPDIDWSAIVTPAAQFGDAADQAHAFVARVRQMKSGTAA